MLGRAGKVSVPTAPLGALPPSQLAGFDQLASDGEAPPHHVKSVLGAKLAVTAWSELMVRVRVLAPVQSAPEEPSPDQPPNAEPDVGVPVRVTAVPGAYRCEQALGQLMPVPVTVPAPATETVSEGNAVKVAVMLWSELIVTVHVPVPAQPPPDQPANVDSAAGVAVNTTVVFCV